MFKIIKTALLLGLVCFLSAFSLAKVYQNTKEKIAAQSEAGIFLKDLMPEGERFDQEVISKRRYFRAYGRGDELIGYVIPAETGGYGGKIKLLLGLDRSGKVLNFKVLEHNETPGLGAKITEPSFISQFKGKSYRQLNLRSVDPKEGKINGITSATISSQAVVNSIKEAISFFEENLKEK